MTRVTVTTFGGVRIEVELMRRLPRTVIIGVRHRGARRGVETADRVRNIITASGMEYPRSRVQVTVSPVQTVSPLQANESSELDLRIALAIVAAAGLVSIEQVTA